MTRAALYLRVSSEAHGWEPEIYREPGRSGDDRGRPEMERLQRDLDAGELDVVWYDVQDRLARDVGFSADFAAALVVADVEVWEAWQPVDLSENGLAQWDIKAVFGAWEKRKIRSRTRKGVRAVEGPWGVPAYGYRKREDGHWEPHLGEVPMVERIFALYLALTSFNAVAVRLNQEGVRPRKAGATWTSTMVANVINGRHVLGELRRGQVAARPAPGDHGRGDVAGGAARGRPGAPLHADRRRTPPARPRVHPRRAQVRPCGSAMIPRTTRHRGTVNETYQCARAKARKADCAMPTLRREQVEVPALRLFEEWALDVDGTRRTIAGQLDARAAEVRAQAARAGREVAELRAQLAHVTRDHRRRKLSAEEYMPLMYLALTSFNAVAVRLNQEGVRPARPGRRKDVGALRSATAQVFSVTYVMPAALLAEQVRDDEQAPGITPIEAPIDGTDLVVVPAVRDEMIVGAAGEPDEFLRRVAVAFGAPGGNQQETLVWKYMTQKTLRPL